MPKYFTDLKNVGGVCQQIDGLEKCWGVMLKYFRDLKKMLGGEGHNCQFWSCSLILSTFLLCYLDS